MLEIIHFSTVHFRDDSRIRSKMMSSLQTRYPGMVALYVQDGKGDEIDAYNGYPVVDTGPRMRRLSRMSRGGWRMFRAVLKARPKIAHFHDPELIPWGVLLRLCGIRVIYDVHEDYPEAVRGNFRLPPFLRKTMPMVVGFIEWASAPFFSAIVAATPTILERLPSQKSVLVRNWPMMHEFYAPSGIPMRERPREFAYIGSITFQRNIIGMLDAVEMAHEGKAVLRLAGDFIISSEEATAREHPGWKDVRYDGWVSRSEVAQILNTARAGLVVLQPVERFKLAYPIKLFEYMAAGIPVIASNFPLWREFVDEARCGLLVDPERPEEIAKAMLWMIDNPEEAEAMGRRGRAAILERYNWDQEADALIQSYERILGRLTESLSNSRN